MARILVTQPLVDGGDARLRASEHDVVQRTEAGPMPAAELVAASDEFDAIVCLLSDQITDEVLHKATRLKVVGNVAVGVDNIDRVAAASAGVAVVNTPGVLDAATADIAILLMLSTRRGATKAEADLRAGRWEGWSLGDHLGRDLTGATVGLLGYGRIGQAVARRLQGFDATVLHHTRNDTGLPGWTSSLHDMAAVADVLSIHVPSTDATRHLVDAAVIAALPDGAVVINTARGPVLDEMALADALLAGRIAGAGLDVFDGEPEVNPRLLEAPGCTLLPHIGSATVTVRRAMCDLACAGVLAVLAGETPSNIVTP